MEELICVYCWKRYPTRGRWAPGSIPLCDCGEILKPNVVLFGEPIPWLAQEQAEEEARTCGVLVVIGTSAQVSRPATSRGSRRNPAPRWSRSTGRNFLKRKCDRHPPEGERLEILHRILEVFSSDGGSAVAPSQD